VDNWLNRIRFPKRYDYVFVKNTDAVGLQVVRYEPEYLKPPLSDHDPVILELADDHPCD
jgi:endonuclease/exonuclease/phosphatase family metal-dependent hydrolase